MMMSEGSGSAHTRRLRVNVRRTRDSEIEEANAYAVLCPERQAQVSLDECARCQRSLGIDRTDREVFLRCTETGTPHTHPQRWERTPPSGVPGAADSTPVADLMTREVVCATPDMSIEALAAQLLEHNISGLPVVDPAGKPVGVVTKTDLLRLLHDHRDAKLGETLVVRVPEGTVFEVGTGFRLDAIAGFTVGDIMTPMTLALPTDAPVARAAAMMASERVHRLPIVSSTGVVVGMLSSLDVLRWLAQSSGYLAAVE